MGAALVPLTEYRVTDKCKEPAMHRVHELVTECSSLLVVTLLSNPELYRDLQICKLDEGIVCQDMPSPEHHCNVLVRHRALSYRPAYCQTLHAM